MINQAFIWHKKSGAKRRFKHNLDWSAWLLMQDINKSVESYVAVKKPDSMIRLCFDPTQTPNVEPDVGISANGSVISNVVGKVRTTEKFISENFNDVMNGFFDVSLSKNLVLEPETDVVPNVTTFLVEIDHPDIEGPKKFKEKISG
ncbi:unnamed protein product [Vicia faba]|uniref:Uncharacterized protein n=1 Tax=Vicia faba TaxID=3906 RepID=A0AAV0ZST3_VICFA|nr:unnamed protein product [Vicia faba]